MFSWSRNMESTGNWEILLFKGRLWDYSWLKRWTKRHPCSHNSDFLSFSFFFFSKSLAGHIDPLFFFLKKSNHAFFDQYITIPKNNWTTSLNIILLLLLLLSPSSPSRARVIFHGNSVIIWQHLFQKFKSIKNDKLFSRNEIGTLLEIWDVGGLQNLTLIRTFWHELGKRKCRIF